MLAFDLLLVLGALPVIAASGYLFLLTLASIRRAPPAEKAPRLKFDFVVPAHDEEAGIARTVQNLIGVDYPAELFRVLVVADNCSDATAERAGEAGATVLVRMDSELRGKGYALEHAFEKSLADGFADAVVVVDADTVVSPNLLRAFSGRIEQGAGAVQAHYGVMNPNASWRTRLMVIALGMFHQVRSQARENLGVSCGLRGNGMCFTHAALRKVPHKAYSLVEDLEYGVRLGEAGHRVFYAGEAHVLGEMVSSERSSRSQRRRWEDGRRAMARQVGWPLLGRALRQRSGLLLDLAIDVLVPPLSRIVGFIGLGAALAAGLSLYEGAPLVSLAVFAVCLLFLAGYVLRGWWMSGAGASGLVALAAAPAYMAWKVVLILRPANHPRGAWVRTTREGEPRQ